MPICAWRSGFTASTTTTWKISVTITDPQMYTKPWVALDKMRFESQPDDFDVREMICAPSEYQGYEKEVGDPASSEIVFGPPHKPKPTSQTKLRAITSLPEIL